MKKIFLIVALAGFVGAASATSIKMLNNKVAVCCTDDKDKKECKKDNKACCKKGEAKACCKKGEKSETKSEKPAEDKK